MCSLGHYGLPEAYEKSNYWGCTGRSQRERFCRYSNKTSQEGFRKIITHISNIHFAPTKYNKKILVEEGVPKKNIFITGNPVIDTIKESIKYINQSRIKKIIDNRILKELKFLPKNFILITIHRRENFGKQFEKICDNINILSKKYEDLKFIYPVHPNPYVQKTALKIILGEYYEDYETALDQFKLKTLEQRREDLCLTFAMKCTNNETHKHIFKPSDNPLLHHPTIFQIPFSLNERYRKSPIPYLTDLLNKHHETM